MACKGTRELSRGKDFLTEPATQIRIKREAQKRVGRKKMRKNPHTEFFVVKYPDKNIRDARHRKDTGFQLVGT